MIPNIPEEYRDKLEFIEPTDRRTDEQVLASLSEHKPVTSEKNVWAYWHSGLTNMPKWNQRNVIDWVRILGPEWTVRVLDSVAGSVNNVLRFAPETLMPRAFVDRTMEGPYVGQHGADLTRTACLYEHGGVWMDVGSFLVRHLDRVCWNELEDLTSPYKVAIFMLWGLAPGNFFVAARKKDPLIYQWHRLFSHLWGDKKDIQDVLNDPLIAPVIPQTFENMSENFDYDWVDFNIAAGYAAQIICLTRLLCLEESDDGFSGVEYWRKNVLALDAGQETARTEWNSTFVGFGQRALDILALPCSGPDAEPTSDKYKDAEKVVWDMLANSTIWKVTHAQGLTHTPQLGTLLDMPENEGKDAAPNTFGELFRYGTRSFRQKRESVLRMPKREPTMTWKKGVLEP
ncbi:hypothetical protein ASPZODRAFT_137036 [Penicilliopsis zonata CBS 506.65]|uniref:Capsule polysaccharide biosynthesis protein n=1 Tax=Penicilliopsis zonata CBS 506.65 TaxID=1073090 RepID=A0A1L9S660_9EURO|nr:hypothetical protein ASPZODRAFT_137036 [Penicilliopsis zonata CBS 506.65]OJJ42649.1 hypothetical protein ASPZODRAFT_137036 [Penicilliopsis zonata CBS 506.65]